MSTYVRVLSKTDIISIVKKEVSKQMENWDNEFTNLLDRYRLLEERIKTLEVRDGQSVSD